MHIHGEDKRRKTGEGDVAACHASDLYTTLSYRLSVNACQIFIFIDFFQFEEYNNTTVVLVTLAYSAGV